MEMAAGGMGREMEGQHRLRGTHKVGNEKEEMSQDVE